MPPLIPEDLADAMFRDDVINAAITPITGVTMEQDTPVWVPDAERAWRAGTIINKTLQDHDSLITRYNTGDLILDVELENLEDPYQGRDKPPDVSTKEEVVRVVIRGYQERILKGDIDDFPEVKLRNVVEGGDAVVSDLIKLVHLNEPAILHSLIERSKTGNIYTNTGPILLAMNPFKYIEHLYSKETLIAYYQAGLHKRDKMKAVHSWEQDSSNTLKPHVYTLADGAFRSMLMAIKNPHLNLRRNQSILVSGESGAGKTETTKIIMRYLAIVASGSGAEEAIEAAYRTDSGPRRSSVTSENAVISIEREVLESNPILEAFGNSRTIRNDNSSRFGKFIRIQFDRQGKLVGGVIQTYLLEKVRVVSPGLNERNYHIFYELMCGATQSEKARWHLTHPMEHFRYLSQSGCYKRQDGVDDTRQFEITRNSMAIMNFSLEEQEEIFTLLVGLLYLGNVTFTPREAKAGDDESSEISDPAALEALQEMATLCGLDPDSVGKVLVTRTVAARGEKFTVQLSPSKAAEARDGLAKAIYGTLFTYIVSRINQRISHEGDTFAFVGLLDIFGFEVFEVNSFEQLCINYANECLQNQFNEHIFKLEQSEYETEGIRWSYIDFPNNEQSVELIQGSTGILRLLDEECLFPKGSDSTFAQKLYSRLGKHPKFEVSNFQKVKEMFVVKHYAGSVLYSTQGFIDKNKDLLHSDSRAVLARTTHILLQHLFGPLASSSSVIGGEEALAAAPGSMTMMRRSSSINAMSLGSQFKTQLTALVKTIRSTAPHYVRCIKPNDLNAPDTFNAPRIVSQLRYSGVLEAVRVARAGYPVRYAHEEFVDQYYMLGVRIINGKAIKVPTRGRDMEKVAKELLEIILRREWSRAIRTEAHSHDKREDASFDVIMEFYGFQLGKTKIFLRKRSFALLEQRRAQYVNYAAIIIQKAYKGWKIREWMKKLDPSARQIQRVLRGFIGRGRSKAYRRNRAAVRLQKHYRGFYLRRRFMLIRWAAGTIQRAYRRSVGAQKFQAQSRAARSVQSWYRAQAASRQFQLMRAASIVVQCAWRRFRAGAQLTELKAREEDRKERQRLEEERQRELQRQEEERQAQLRRIEEEKQRQIQEEMERREREAEIAAKARAADQLKELQLSLEEQIRILTEERDELKGLVQQLHQEKGSVSSALGHTEISLRMANDELEDLRGHLGRTLEQLKRTGGELSEAKKELKEREGKALVAPQELEAFRERERAALSELEALRSKLAAAQKQLLEISAATKKTAENLGEVPSQSFVAESRERNQGERAPDGALQIDLVKIWQELRAMNGTLGTVQSEQELTAQKLDQVQEQVEEGFSETSKFQAQLDRQIERLDVSPRTPPLSSAPTSAAPELQSLVNSLQRDKEQLETVNTEQSERIRLLEKRMDDILSTLAEGQKATSSLEQRLVERDERIKALERRNDELMQGIVSSTEERSEYQRIIALQKMEMAEMSNQVQQLSIKLNSQKLRSPLASPTDTQDLSSYASSFGVDDPRLKLSRADVTPPTSETSTPRGEKENVWL